MDTEAARVARSAIPALRGATVLPSSPCHESPMKRWPRVLVFWILTALGPNLSGANTLPQDAIRQKAKSAVWLVIATDTLAGYQSRGSGFVLDRHGHVVTNEHVVRGANHFELVQDDRRLKADLMWEYPWEDKYRDLAILKTREPLTNVEPIELALSNPLDGVPDVYAYGFPMVSEEHDPNYDQRQAHIREKDYRPRLTGSDGTIRREFEKGDQIVHHSASTSRGSSGGPLFDACGRVIGVNSFTAAAQVFKDGNEQKIETREGNNWAVFAGVLTQEIDKKPELQVEYNATLEKCLAADSDGSDRISGSVIHVDRGGVGERRDTIMTVNLSDLNLGMIFVVLLAGAILCVVAIRAQRGSRSRRPVLTVLAILLGIGVFALLLSSRDGDGPGMSEQAVGVPKVQSFAVHNRSGEGISQIGVKPHGAHSWKKVSLPWILESVTTHRLPEHGYESLCRFDIHIVGVELDHYAFDQDLCSDDAVVVPPYRPFRIDTVPPNASLTVKNSDGRIVWRVEDGPMSPPPNPRLPYGHYKVMVEADGYDPLKREATVVHRATSGHWEVPLCRPPSEIAGPEADAVARDEYFLDCESDSECPQMVVVPAGCLQMAGHDNGRVSIGEPFAVGKFEVTYEQWDACVDDKESRCEKKGEDGMTVGRASRKEGGIRGGPAVNVSWQDAQNYVEWLRKETGKSYRLLSESEWEYAARAGTDTKYAWGDAVGVGKANCRGCGAKLGKKLRPVGSFEANKWKLHDMYGNVQEWVEDCFRGSATPEPRYAEQPRDGTPWKRDGCSRRVVRGGSFRSPPDDLRAGVRRWRNEGQRGPATGFRVARSLEQ